MDRKGTAGRDPGSRSGGPGSSRDPASSLGAGLGSLVGGAGRSLPPLPRHRLVWVAVGCQGPSHSHTLRHAHVYTHATQVYPPHGSTCEHTHTAQPLRLRQASGLRHSNYSHTYYSDLLVKPHRLPSAWGCLSVDTGFCSHGHKPPENGTLCCWPGRTWHLS